MRVQVGGNRLGSLGSASCRSRQCFPSCSMAANILIRGRKSLAEFQLGDGFSRRISVMECVGDALKP